MFTICRNYGIIDSRGDILVDSRKAGGLRCSPLHTLSENEINHLKDEIRTIKADENIFIFNKGQFTGYIPERDTIYIKGNVFPSNDNSIHPRDLMSERAVLAHEYYGHRAYRNTKLQDGSWNDEFRASYMAAKNTPNLNDKDRQYLILDAIERAKEAGVTITYNKFMRRILYGKN